MTVPVADQRRLIHILADDLQPRIDWAYALEQTIALLGGGYLTSGNGDPNGLVTKPEGYLFLDLTTPAVWQNQNGGTVWLQLGTGGGGGSTITVSASDPGATGAGSGWLLVDGSENPLAFFIRNTADDGWLSDGALPLGALTSSVELADDLDFTGHQARILVIPVADSFGFVTVEQVKFEGDVFPRSARMSDGSHFLGDGTYNPLIDPDTGEWAGYTPLGSHGLLVNGGLSSIRLGSTNPDRLGYLEINGMVFVAHPSVDTPDRSVAMTVPFDLLGQRPDPAMPGEAYVRFFARNAEVTPGNDRTEPAVIDDQGVATPLLRLFSTLPPDINIPASGLALALDDTPGAVVLKVKAKDSTGTVVNRRATYEQMPFMDPVASTPEAIVNALIGAGLMAAS